MRRISAIPTALHSINRRSRTMFMEAITRACQVYGIAIAISMVVAVLIKLLVSATGRLAVQSAASSSPSPNTSAKPAPQASLAKDELPDEDVAVIAAAVIAAIGPHRILSIQPRDDDSWSKIGRAAQHQHQPRH